MNPEDIQLKIWLEIYKNTASKIDFMREVWRISEDVDLVKQATDRIFGNDKDRRYMAEGDSPRT